MAIQYDEVVPWGRNYDEYCRMFDLTHADLKKRIIGCGDGPASFNHICNMNGGNVVSVDPIYSLSMEQITERIRVTFDNVLSQTRKNQEKFLWDDIGSVDNLGNIRMSAMNQFLETYEEDKKCGKYVAGALPKIPFPDDSFNISLCSHFLFLYSDNLSYEFHYDAICELLRVSNEARIFPLVDVNTCKSIHVDRIINDLQQYDIEIRKVNYEFQMNGNEMMRISKRNNN